MQTLPSIQRLAQVFGCQPQILEHPEYGLLKYDLKHETEHDRITLLVQPANNAVSLTLTTKNPIRVVRLDLECVQLVEVVEQHDEARVMFRFLNEELQPLILRLAPSVLLIWRNLHGMP